MAEITESIIRDIWARSRDALIPVLRAADYADAPYWPELTVAGFDPTTGFADLPVSSTHEIETVKFSLRRNELGISRFKVSVVSKTTSGKTVVLERIWL